MTNLRILAVLLLAAGIATLLYGGFNYTRSTQQAKIGPLELTTRETERVNIPVWVGFSAVFAGVGILVLRR